MTALRVSPPTEAAGRTEDDALRSKREQIVEQAIVMFNQLGYHGTRVGDITESLNMGKGSFYLHFRNKKELLLACYAHVDELIREIRAVPYEEDGDFLVGISARAVRVNTRSWWSGLLNLLKAGELSPDDEIRASARQAMEKIATNLTRDMDEAIQAGVVQEIDTELAAYAFMGLTDNIWYRSRFDGRYSAEELLEFTVNVVRRWLESDNPPRDNRAFAEAARIVSRDGSEFELANLRCDGTNTLAGTIGLARVDIDLAHMSQLAIEPAGDECLAILKTNDEAEIQLRIDGAVIVSGDIRLGSFRVPLRIALKDLSTLDRD